MDMKPIETVKKWLGWGPTVVRQLERVAAIDERLPHIAAAQKAEGRLVPEAEHAARLADWIRRKKLARSGLHSTAETLLPLGLPTPRDPHLVGEDFENLFFAFFGDQMEQAAPRVVAEIYSDHPEPRGRPAAERAAILARLGEERAQLVAERADLVDAIVEASSGTVMIQHLPETQHERDVAARVAKQAALNEEIQRAHKAGVPVGTPTVVHSPFIQSGERGR